MVIESFLVQRLLSSVKRLVIWLLNPGPTQSRQYHPVGGAGCAYFAGRICGQIAGGSGGFRWLAQEVRIRLSAMA